MLFLLIQDFLQNAYNNIYYFEYNKIIIKLKGLHFYKKAFLIKNYINKYYKYSA